MLSRILGLLMVFLLIIAATGFITFNYHSEIREMAGIEPPPPIILEIPVQENFDNVVFLAIFPDGSVKVVDSPEPVSGAEYMMEVRYSSEEQNYYMIQVVLEFADGFRVLEMPLPGGKLKIDYRRFPQPAPEESSGY